MSIDIYNALNKIVLEEEYDEDISKKCVNFFEELGVKLEELLEWQKKYPIIYPWDKDYSIKRLGYNRIGQYFPKFIMMAKRKSDVQWALKIALKYNIPFVPRSGGHCSVNTSLCNGIIIDLSHRNYIKIDDKGITKIGAGIRLGELVLKLGEENRFCSIGSCQNTGTNFFSGGGIGYLRRKFGLGIDNLLSITIILADGTIIKANKDVNTDLFWGLRGGGGNSFGVITDLTIHTHELEKMVIFKLWINFRYFDKVFDIWQRWNFEAPHELTSWIQFFPQNNKYPEQILIAGQFFGRKKDLLKLLNIFEDFISFKSLHYDTFVKAACECCSHPNYFYKYLTLFAPNYLSYETIKGLKKIVKKMPENSTIEIDGMGGKISEVPSNDTAFPYRNSKFWIIVKMCGDDQEKIPIMEKWTKSTHNFLINNGVCDEKTGLPQNYVNFKDLELSPKNYPLSYWNSNAERLSKIKRKYDPDNIFHFSQSVPLNLIQITKK